MRPVSAAYKRAVRGSHNARTRVRAVTPGQTGTTPTGEVLEVLGGSVILDAEADVRSTVDLEVAGTFPTTSTHALAPYGQEVYVERGIEYGNGATEWVSLGYFRVEDVDQLHPGAPLRVTGSDRWAGIADARLTAPRQFTAATTYGAVVDALVTEVHPAAVIEWDDTTDTLTLGRSVIVEEDRAGFLRELFTARGKVGYYDHRGVLVIRTPPDPGTPVDTIDAGRNGVLVELGRSVSRWGVYNGVVVTGEAPDQTAPVRAVAVDANPESPTYWSGSFGPVPRFYGSPLITTTAQARTAAETILRGGLGLPYNVNAAAIPDASFEPLDPVAITYTDAGTPRTETHVLRSITVPLDVATPLTFTTREQTHVTIGDAA